MPNVSAPASNASVIFGLEFISEIFTVSENGVPTSSEPPSETVAVSVPAETLLSVVLASALSFVSVLPQPVISVANILVTNNIETTFLFI